MDILIYKGNLFNEIKHKDPHYEKYVLGHCISADAGMGAGIAVDFVKKFPAIKRLRQKELEIGQSYFIEPVYNIVTKRKYSGKPTYQSMEAALCSLCERMHNNYHQYLAIPKIGCGLDGLQWAKVQGMLMSIFYHYDVRIEVYHL